MCEYEDKYEMHQVNLNNFSDKSKKNRIYKMEKRLTIDRDAHEDLQAFHVRGGDLKNQNSISANNKSIAFFIFNNKVYYWMTGMEEELSPVLMKVNK